MFDVANRVTPRSNNVPRSRPRIIASVMSETWNSSKHSTRAPRGDPAGNDP